MHLEFRNPRRSRSPPKGLWVQSSLLAPLGVKRRAGRAPTGVGSSASSRRPRRKRRVRTSCIAAVSSDMENLFVVVSVLLIGTVAVGDRVVMNTTAVELGLGTIPTFIVGHMSGENWDPAWRDGRDLYGDVWLVGRQAWFAEQVARRFAALQIQGFRAQPGAPPLPPAPGSSRSWRSSPGRTTGGTGWPR